LAGSKVVDRHSILAQQPPDTAPESQAGDAGLGHYAAGHRKPEKMSFAVQISESGASLDSNDGTPRIDMHRSQAREIDNKAVSAKSAAADIVTATAHRSQQAVFASEVDGVHNIRDASAASDESRPFVDARIPDLAGFIEAAVLRFEQLTAECGLECL